MFPNRPQRLHKPPAVEADTNGDVNYEVECILAQRGSATRRELLVRWVGYGAEDDQWQPRSKLVRSAPIAVANFDALQRHDGVQASLHQLLALALPQLIAA